jgi:hypothetical protein
MDAKAVSVATAPTGRPSGSSAQDSAAGPRGARIISVVYVLTLIVFLFVCAVQTAFPIWHFRPVDENRNPTPLSEYVDNLLFREEQLPLALNNWFDDRFGFRAPFIRAYNEFQYRVFGTSARVHIGTDGFLFAKIFWNEELEDSRKAGVIKDKVLANIRDWSAYLAERGIKLVLVPMPSKNDFYASYVPASAPRPAGPLLAHQLRPLLKAQKDLIYVDADAAIRAAAEKGVPERLYYRLDPHMNFWGALLVAQATAEAIAADAHMKVPPWYQFGPTRVHSFPGGYDQRALGLFDPLMENLISPNDFGLIGRETAAGSWQVKDPVLDIGIDADNPDARYEYLFRAREDRIKELLPPIQLYGDSFGDHFILARFQEEFASVFRSRLSPTRPIMDVMEHIPKEVRYFVVAFNEGVISRFAAPAFAVDLRKQ